MDISQITPKYRPNNSEVYAGLMANRQGLEIWVDMGEIWAYQKLVETLEKFYLR
jgi:NDP-sugar pyrophosphorylase family protein